MQCIIPGREVAASGVSFSALSSLCPGEVIEVAALMFKRHPVSKMRNSTTSQVKGKSIYAETVGTAAMIRGRAFRGLPAGTLGCLVILSAGSGVEVRLRLDLRGVDPST